MDNRIAVRHQQRRPDGSPVYRDTELTGSQLTIGRDPGSQIVCQSPEVAMEHAVIAWRTNGSASIQCRSGQVVSVNGQLTSTSALSPGDVVAIGELLIEIAAAESTLGAVIVEVNEAAKVDPANIPPPITANPRRRGLSWALAAIILLVFLIFPLLIQFGGKSADVLRSLPLPDDGLWNPGPLHQSHAFTGDNCELCHVKPFVQVEDIACLDCHMQMTVHADISEFPMHGVDAAGCTDCHTEHKEPAALLNRADALCTDCHADLQQAGHPTDLRDASNFIDDHPSFHASIRQSAGTISGPADLLPERQGAQRVALSTSGLEENSGLKFSHKVHMDPEGVTAPDGREFMACESCHRPDAAGRFMEPMTFEADCQRCHKLEFTAASDREVPHATPDEVLVFLREYYSHAALNGWEEPPVLPPSEVETRARPGRAPKQFVTEREREAALQQARREADQAATHLFSKSNCGLCHSVSLNDAAESGSSIDAVAVTEIWLPKSTFDHASHVTMPCADCHQAESSETSKDILIPDIDNCQQCHQPGRAPADCISCHQFHLPNTARVLQDIADHKLIEKELEPVLDDANLTEHDRIRKELEPVLDDAAMTEHDVIRKELERVLQTVQPQASQPAEAASGD